ncbi:MAG: tripartite tricarboxylate transporter substrate binding protein [Lachnospiraceae bacterium]|nr:tripartite tricarboxylate transporter substrate binding protein [Lachnospiraceae bacterium]
MKKIMSYLLTGLLCLGLLSGCSSSSSTSDTTEAETTAVETTAEESTAAETEAVAETSADDESDEAVEASYDWAEGNVSIYVPYSAGGMSDSHTRVLADYLQDRMDVAVSVVNQDSGSGVTAYETVRNADPDGLTLLSVHAGFMCSYYLGNYDYTYEDFTVIAFLQNQGNNVFAVPADSPYDTLEDLVEAAKENPGGIKAGITSGASTQFIFGALQDEADITFEYVDGGSESEKLTSLMGGYLDVTVVSKAAALEYETAGEIKVLAAIGESDDNYVTTVELGYESVIWDTGLILLGPPNMDEELVEEINASFAGIVDDEETVELITNLGGTAEWMNVEDSYARMVERESGIHEIADALGINVR